MALDGLDHCICAVLGGSDRFQGITPRHNLADHQVRTIAFKLRFHTLLEERESNTGSYCFYPPFLLQMETMDAELRSFECSVISPLRVLYVSIQNVDVRAGSLKILLHVLEVTLFILKARFGESTMYND